MPPARKSSKKSMCAEQEAFQALLRSVEATGRTIVFYDRFVPAMTVGRWPSNVAPEGINLAWALRQPHLVVPEKPGKYARKMLQDLDNMKEAYRGNASGLANMVWDLLLPAAASAMKLVNEGKVIEALGPLL
eukprot:3514837-Prymnesium_polylepis.1